jgi:hypothetical protein
MCYWIRQKSDSQWLQHGCSLHIFSCDSWQISDKSLMLHLPPCLPDATSGGGVME